MRQLTEHVHTDHPEQIELTAEAPVPPGGAPIAYHASWESGGAHFMFQSGPIPDVGINGLTDEVLIAIVLDRLRGFQQGGFPCRQNALAITKLEEALMWLNNRTEDRIRRGVEGRMER